MDSEIQGAGAEVPSAEIETTATPVAPTPAPEPRKDIRWVFMGPQGMRAGWSVAIFLSPAFAFQAFLWLASHIQKLQPQATASAPPKASAMTPAITIIGEGVTLVLLLVLVMLMALIERRHPIEYYFREKRLVSKFLSGLIVGFAALSALVGALSLGSWIHFGPVALSGWQILSYAALWGVAFLLVGLVEEILCRCYLQFTLTRGINFWWALGVVALLCATMLRHKGEEAWGVYGFAAAGLILCLWLYLAKKNARSSFWYAAWATSTFFGWIHTSNHGENWIGIFAAALIGFVFCVSVWATGSAWWAIGCHAAWDWAESYFYGTADSGMAAKGHLLTTTPAGSAMWSGGANGPEGSLLVIPIVLLILVAVLAQYGRSKKAEAEVSANA